MKALRTVFALGYHAIVLLFVVCAFVLIVFAALELWHGVNPADELPLQARFNLVLEAVGLLTVAVAALELGQTVLEEETRRAAQMSGPTRARRFLSRFLVVIVVALAIETLVAVFHFVHEQPERLPHAAWVGFAAAALLAAWGVFVRLNRSAEELEPEAMERVKSEDHKVEQDQLPGP